MKKENPLKFYLNNSQLKRKGYVHNYTKEEAEEYVKCYNDILYFIRNYVYIISLDKGKVLFQPYDFQLDMIEKFQNNKFVISNLARQLGKCCSKDSKIRVRNKETGEVLDVSLGEFYQKVKQTIESQV